MCGDNFDCVHPEYTFSSKPVRDMSIGVFGDLWDRRNSDGSLMLHHVEKVWAHTGVESMLLLSQIAYEMGGGPTKVLAAHAAIYHPESDVKEDDWL